MEIQALGRVAIGKKGVAMLDSCGDLARSILDNIGGLDNIESVAHCFTRVRFKLVDEGRADTAAIEALPGVLR